MREQEPEREQEHDPSKVALKIKVPLIIKKTFRVSIGAEVGAGPPVYDEGERIKPDQAPNRNGRTVLTIRLRSPRE